MNLEIMIQPDKKHSVSQIPRCYDFVQWHLAVAGLCGNVEDAREVSVPLFRSRAVVSEEMCSEIDILGVPMPFLAHCWTSFEQDCCNQDSVCQFFIVFLLDPIYFLTRVTQEYPATWDSRHSVCVATPGSIRTSFIGEPPRWRISHWEMENRQVVNTISHHQSSNHQFVISIRFITAIYSITSEILEV